MSKMLAWHDMQNNTCVCRIPPSAVVTSHTGGATVVSHSYLLHLTGWGRRSRFLTADQEIPEEAQATAVSNDVILVVDVQLPIDPSLRGAKNEIDCTVELAPNYWRAIAVLGHHQVCLLFALVSMAPLGSEPHVVKACIMLRWLQLGVVPSAATVILMMARIGFRLGLSSGALWHVCIGVIIWMHDVPLHSVRAATCSMLTANRHIADFSYSAYNQADHCCWRLD